MLTRIEVTQDRINTGNPGDPCRCAVAKSILSHLRDEVHVRVHYSYMSFIVGRDEVTIKLPSEATSFILAIDYRQKVAPFVFDLDIPAEFLEPTPC